MRRRRDRRRYGVQPLDDLVTHGDEGDGEDRKQEEDDAATHGLGTHQGFGGGERVEAYTEMRHAIVMVSVEAEQVGHKANGTRSKV